MWLLVISDWSILKTNLKNFAPPGLYPPPCTLPSSVHCPVRLHTGPAPTVYTAFLLMPCQLRFEPATMISQDQRTIHYTTVSLAWL